MSENNNMQSAHIVDVRGLSKKYGSKQVLTDIDLSIQPGEIVGLIGPNGAGKSTLLKALMGLIKYSGNIAVFGQNPYKNRSQLLKNMSYIADVASLPNWMLVSDLLSFVDQTHPKFSYDKAVQLLSETDISDTQKIETLSKGMKTRLHLIIILSIASDFMILDEPTLGLDVLVRRDFQDRLINDYFQLQESASSVNKQQRRSILITTHQIDEVESILTRVLFIKDGRITLDIKKSELKQRYSKLLTQRNVVFADKNIKPIYQRDLPEATELIFADVDPEELRQYGEVVTPSLEDLFVATNT
ncbi:MAG: ABC transporter ATP-binding protein [Arenicella sp.]